MYKKYAEIRDKVGVTDYRVAKETGLDYPTLVHWKHGLYTPKYDKLKKIADYLGVIVEDFYGD